MSCPYNSGHFINWYHTFEGSRVTFSLLKSLLKNLIRMKSSSWSWTLAFGSRTPEAKKFTGQLGKVPRQPNIRALRDLRFIKMMWYALYSAITMTTAPIVPAAKYMDALATHWLISWISCDTLFSPSKLFTTGKRKIFIKSGHDKVLHVSYFPVQLQRKIQ